MGWSRLHAIGPFVHLALPEKTNNKSITNDGQEPCSVSNRELC